MRLSIRNLSLTKKIVVAGTAVALSLGVGGAAFAYFTSTSTAAGTAAVGSATNGFAITGTTASGAMYPDPAIGVGPGSSGSPNYATDIFFVQNSSNGAEKLHQVIISVANADGSTWSSQNNASKPACTAADFSVNGAAVGQPDTYVSAAASWPKELQAGASTGGIVTIQMIDNGANQDNCQGVNVPLYFVAS